MNCGAKMSNDYFTSYSSRGTEIKVSLGVDLNKKKQLNYEKIVELTDVRVPQVSLQLAV